MDSSDQVYFIGERCYLENHFGTVRYIGAIPPTEGIWYGVEWDEERGKHNGSLNGTCYFSCKDKHGSFIRPAKVKFGISASEALEKTYGAGKFEGDAPIIVNTKTNEEKIIEMIGFDKVAAQQCDFTKLREVDLSHCKISHAKQHSGLGNLLPNLNVLNLRGNLLSSLKDVYLIAANIKSLKSLNISENILSNYDLPEDVGNEIFTQLTSIFVNKMRLNWEQLLSVVKMTPNVTDVHACFNEISEIRFDSSIDNLVILNMEGNQVSSWQSILNLSSLQRLKRLIVNSNGIEDVYIPSDQCFPALESISLSNNLINKWNSINEINKMKCVTEIRFRNNPLCKDLTGASLREELIARLPNIVISNGSQVIVVLSTLTRQDKTTVWLLEPGNYLQINFHSTNGTVIEKLERKMAELAYIKKYSTDYFNSKSGNGSLNFHSQHPYYNRLIELYGPPEEQVQKKVSMKDGLLELIFKFPDRNDKASVQKKFPGTMTIQQLKGFLQRQYKVPHSKQILSYLDRKNNREINLDDNMKQLTYFSVTSGDTIFVRF